MNCKQMKTKLEYVICIGLFFILLGCNDRSNSTNENVIYTCSMDPQVKGNKPGNCPICKMPLTPVSTNTSTSPDELKLSDQQIELGNISTDSVAEHVIGKELFVTGTLIENQNNVSIISSRISGRIDNLYVKTTGQNISEGQKLYTIYSEELLLALNELKLAQEKAKNPGANMDNLNRIIRSTKNKLILFGLSDEQITELSSADEIPISIPIYSKTDGVVSNINITEGGYVNAGTEILQISNYTTLWAQAELFSEDISKIRNGSVVIVSIPALNKFDLKGVVSLVNPSVEQNTKLNVIRVVLENKDGLLKPGMQANFSIVYDSFSALAVPVNSVLLDEVGATIWIQTGLNSYKSRMVEIGVESNGFVEIKKGISRGENVVVSGAYLLNSEFIFQKGSNPMAGHDMSKM